MRLAALITSGLSSIRTARSSLPTTELCHGGEELPRGLDLPDLPGRGDHIEPAEVALRPVHDGVPTAARAVWLVRRGWIGLDLDLLCTISG